MGKRESERIWPAESNEMNEESHLRKDGEIEREGNRDRARKTKKLISTEFICYAFPEAEIVIILSSNVFISTIDYTYVCVFTQLSMLICIH